MTAWEMTGAGADERAPWLTEAGSVLADLQADVFASAPLGPVSFFESPVAVEDHECEGS